MKERPEFHTRLYVMAVIFIFGSLMLIVQSLILLPQSTQVDAPAWVSVLLLVAIGIAIFNIVLLAFIMAGKLWARNVYLVCAVLGWVLTLFQGGILQVLVSVLLFWFMFSKDWGSFEGAVDN